MEKTYSIFKILLLPVIVFLIMQYQIDKIKAEHSAAYYHERIQDVQDELYRLELEVMKYNQLQRITLDHVFDEIDTIREERIEIKVPESLTDVRG